ncbi:MAG: DNA-deoxyinosine glycosylase [Candidatus Accumulibacter sp.]|uniref:DNA-deoxyinosine glycosylase n=1 Tax=Accumulibacter sp. TaxID=2053492 RepID=UPI002878C8E2|nr:DNA-deoxyinosine glycosylase [Accumulibacter sp.]MDS4013018.1 DNA-deoxyinosine glycosylase [Accumulibacter sp.]
MGDGGPQLLHGLPPIVDAGIRTLILGSFPSPASLAAQQYYAHRRNQFWQLLAALLGETLVELDYRKRSSCLLAHGIGVWDVYASCYRTGALDSAIEAGEPNDFSRLDELAPQLERIGFNGQTAGRFAPWFAARGFTTTVLPSSSPAYTLAFDEKLARWAAAGIGATPARSA